MTQRTVGKWLAQSTTMGTLMLAGCLAAKASDNGWVKPTPQELTMTSIPGYPGAAAVILNREEITKDDLHVMQHYERIKILTEKGKEKANVELGFAQTHDDGYYTGDDKDITDIEGRTIHPDGTVIPFTGKPYLKQMFRNKTFSYKARVFTLPDVEVGSIIEYRYAVRISDYIFESPAWRLQDELYTKKAHFVWYPTSKPLNSDEGAINTISWFQILPTGAEVKRREMPGVSGGSSQQIFELNASDVPPEPTEDHMPPISSFTYRVLFYYTPYRTAAEFWSNRGKKWSKGADSFAGPNGGLRDATQAVIAGATSQEDKLRKIYEVVMAMDNTDFSHEHEKAEDKAAGLSSIANALDVYKRKRGSSTQLTELFVGMTRAAGFKAYMMLVPDRSERLFIPSWLSFQQFDDMLAIVNVDGKERFFAPGSRYCPFGHVNWENTFVNGLRQVDGGTTFGVVPGDNYQDSRTQRVGDLTVGEHGEVTGTLSMTYTGSPALTWRHGALNGDDESLRTKLKDSVQAMIPKTLEVKVAGIDNLRDYEKPLIVHFSVTGGMGTPTGKRLILPMDVFLTEGGGTFPHEKRELAVYFHYPETIQDAVRVKYPASMTLEASPANTKVAFMDMGQYTVSSAVANNSITVRRNLLFNGVVIESKDYPTLRNFFSQFETKDKDSIVLRAGASGAATTGN